MGVWCACSNVWQLEFCHTNHVLAGMLEPTLLKAVHSMPAVYATAVASLGLTQTECA